MDETNLLAYSWCPEGATCSLDVHKRRGMPSGATASLNALPVTPFTPRVFVRVFRYASHPDQLALRSTSWSGCARLPRRLGAPLTKTRSGAPTSAWGPQVGSVRLGPSCPSRMSRFGGERKMMG